MSTHAHVPQQQVQRTGRMTALMRTVTQHEGPRVLRIGLVVSGRVVEERIVKQRTTVSIGQSERATFVLPGAPDVDLFERSGNGYVLNFTDAMMGRVQCADGIKDLASLRARSKRVGSTYCLALAEDARGKVTIGDATFLFQFVEPPPPAARPQLPLSVKGSLGGQIDWALTMVAAFSFMLHFGFIGAMYSDWSDQVVTDDVTVQGLADLLNKVPPPTPEDRIDDPSTVTPTPTDANTHPTPSHTTNTNANANNAQPGHMSDHAALALNNRAEAMMVDMIGAMNSPTTMEGVLRRSDAPMVDLTQVANSEVGTSPGHDLRLAQNGALTQPNSHQSLTDLGNNHADVHQHAVVTEVTPPPSFAVITPIPATTSIPGADGTIGALRSGYRSCYNKGLIDDAHMSGKIVLSVVVQPNGEVQSVTKSDGSGLSPKVEQCIIDKTSKASFMQGQGGTLKVPVSFYTQ
jgi:hypothetical protein